MYSCPVEREYQLPRVKASSGGRPKSIRRVAMGKDRVPWQDKEGKLGSLGKAAAPRWLYAGATHSKGKAEGEGKKAHHRVQANRSFLGSPDLFWTMCEETQGSRSLALGGKCLTTRPGTSVLTDFLRLPDSADHGKPD